MVITEMCFQTRDQKHSDRVNLKPSYQPSYRFGMEKDGPVDVMLHSQSKY